MTGIENSFGNSFEFEPISSSLREVVTPPDGLHSDIMGYVKRAEAAELGRRKALIIRARELVYACAACFVLTFGVSAVLAPLAGSADGGAPVAAPVAAPVDVAESGALSGLAGLAQSPEIAPLAADFGGGDMILSADIVISVDDVGAAARLIGELGGGVLSSRSAFNGDGAAYSYYAETAVSSGSFDGYLEALERIGTVSSVSETRRKVSSVLDMDGTLARVYAKEAEIGRIFELYSRAGDVRGMDIVSKNLDGVLGELDGLKSAASYWGEQTSRASVRVTLVKAYDAEAGITDAGFGGLFAERLRLSGFAAREALLTFAGLVVPLGVLALFGWCLIKFVKRIDRRVQHA